MNLFLSHIDLSVLVYGVIMFLGITVMLVKALSGSWFSLFIDIAVFVMVFKLHGGTQAGGFAAMIAALLAGLFFPPMIRWKLR